MVVSGPPTINYPNEPNTPPFVVQKPRGEKIGLSVSAIVISCLALVFGLYDLNAVTSGEYGYIFFSEIGMLLIMSVVAVGLAIPAIVQKARLASGALTLSLLALLVTFACARYGG